MGNDDYFIRLAGGRPAAHFLQERLYRRHQYDVELRQYLSRRSLEQRHVLSDELGTYAKAGPLYAQPLQKLRHHPHRTEVSDDPDTVLRVDERYDLVTHDVVGQRHRVGWELLQGIVFERPEVRERVWDGGSLQAQAADLPFKLDRSLLQVRDDRLVLVFAGDAEQPVVGRIEVGAQPPELLFSFGVGGRGGYPLDDAGEQVHQGAGLGLLGNGEGMPDTFLVFAGKVQ